MIPVGTVILNVSNLLTHRGALTCTSGWTVCLTGCVYPREFSDTSSCHGTSSDVTSRPHERGARRTLRTRAHVVIKRGIHRNTWGSPKKSEHPNRAFHRGESLPFPHDAPSRALAERADQGPVRGAQQYRGMDNMRVLPQRVYVVLQNVRFCYLRPVGVWVRRLGRGGSVRPL